MEEALIKREVPFMADEETTEVAQVSKGAFDLPAFAIAAQRASHFARRGGGVHGDGDRSTRSRVPPVARGRVASRKRGHR